MHNIYYLGLSVEHRCPLGYLLSFSLEQSELGLHCLPGPICSKTKENHERFTIKFIYTQK